MKRRIHELCGLINLERTEKIRIANEILNSTELKQAVCNQILGTTFKDVEKAMEAILRERQLTEEQLEILELEKQVPEKFDYEFEFKLNKHASDFKNKSSRYRTYTPGEVAALLAASDGETSSFESEAPKREYEPMPREMAERLVREHFEYKENERKKREEIKWDSQNMTELDRKIASITKRSKSTKTSKR